MLKIKKWVVNSNPECTYVISDETGKTVIVDYGVFYPNERRHLLEYIKKEHLHPVHLLLTHAHHDYLYSNDLVLKYFGLYPEVRDADKNLMLHMLLLRISTIGNEKANNPYFL